MKRKAPKFTNFFSKPPKKEKTRHSPHIFNFCDTLALKNVKCNDTFKIFKANRSLNVTFFQKVPNVYIPVIFNGFNLGAVPFAVERNILKFNGLLQIF